VTIKFPVPTNKNGLGVDIDFGLPHAYFRVILVSIALNGTIFLQQLSDLSARAGGNLIILLPYSALRLLQAGEFTMK
jgi:hypothetical protein